MTVTSQPATLRSLLIIAAAAVVTFAAVDCLIRLAVQPVHLREVEEGVADYQHSDPHVLVLGSSHARTFESVADALAERTGGAQRMVAIPVEFGKLDGYRWVLEHRLLPLMIETGADGQPVRKNLSRFILVTEWWDSCDPPPALNLPSKAWTLPDFIADFLQHGVTDFNRNYLQTRWRRHLGFSGLAQDRGHYRIHEYLRSVMRPKTSANDVELLRYGDKVRMWQGILERGSGCIGNPDQIAALRTVLDTLLSLRVEVTLLLFPRKPDTITAQAHRNTLMPFADIVRTIAATYNARFVDFTTHSPLGDADFMADFDHVTADGNRRFAGWSLDGDLQFLLTPGAAPTAHTSGSVTR